jgi:glyoxylase-like metal-dependent hydrolase (beta-lactamase superfamily II)
MTKTCSGTQSESAYSRFKRIPLSEDWFEAYQVAPDLFVFYEPRHYERTIVNLIIGQQKAALIDTGCGIGNLRKAVEAVTNKPIVVVNTHTHLDHLGSNRQFSEIAMFDHPLCHRVAEKGISHEIVSREILAENLVTGPWPRDFKPNEFALPPFKVSYWLTDSDRLDLGGLDLEAIYTPGEAPDHISLLDRTHRLLFCGDILLHGPVWTHLEGGSLTILLESYKRLMLFFDDFDYLMPCHNQTWLDKSLLPETLDATEKVLSGQAKCREITDPWNRPLKQYSFGRFEILTTG